MQKYYLVILLLLPSFVFAPTTFAKEESVSFIRLVSEAVSQAGALPPFGNVYSKITSQKSLSNNEREVFLESNSPLGTRRYDIWVYPVSSRSAGSRLVKSTKESKTSIIVDAAEDLYLDVRACTVGENCVDAYPLKLDKLAAASDSGQMNVQNSGLLQDENFIEEERRQEEGLISTLIAPISMWLGGLYKSFR